MTSVGKGVEAGAGADAPTIVIINNDEEHA